jgi:hypothetical protein
LRPFIRELERKGKQHGWIDPTLGTRLIKLFILGFNRELSNVFKAYFRFLRKSRYTDKLEKFHKT